MDVIDLKTKLGSFEDLWSPKIVGMVSGHHVYLAKLEGEFVWHAHDNQDEMFLVIEGRFCMEFRNHSQWLEEGQMIIVPAGTEHRPVAPEACSVMIIERADTDHTGGVDDPRRKTNHERI